MAGAGPGLVAASPVGPAEPVGCVVGRPNDECDEQALDLVAEQRDQPVRGGIAGVFVRADDSEEGMGEHGEGDPAGPGRVAAELVLVQAGQALSGLERLFDPSSGSRDLHQGWQEYRLR